MEDTLNVVLIQSHLFWEDPEANRILFSERMASISKTVDLIVLPEMFTTGFTMTPQNIPIDEGIKTVEWMQQTAKEKDVAITGSIIYHEDDAYYNRLFFVFPDGSFKTYDKRHTFSLAGEHKVYESGIEKLLADFRGFKICPMICYDLRFPVWARNKENYDVLLYVANWPKPRITAWDTLLKARAIENMVYCIGVNRIGIDDSGYEYPGHSAVYDVLGNPLTFSDKEGVTEVTLSKEHINTCRNKLKFLEDKDEFNLI